VIYGTVGSTNTEQSNDLNKAAVNSSINVEIDKINESLLRISMVLNVSPILYLYSKSKAEMCSLNKM